MLWKMVIINDKDEIVRICENYSDEQNESFMSKHPTYKYCLKEFICQRYGKK